MGKNILFTYGHYIISHGCYFSSYRYNLVVERIVWLKEAKLLPEVITFSLLIGISNMCHHCLTSIPSFLISLHKSP